MKMHGFPEKYFYITTQFTVQKQRGCEVLQTATIILPSHQKCGKYCNDSW